MIRKVMERDIPGVLELFFKYGKSERGEAPGIIESLTSMLFTLLCPQCSKTGNIEILVQYDKEELIGFSVLSFYISGLDNVCFIHARYSSEYSGLDMMEAIGAVARDHEATKILTCVKPKALEKYIGKNLFDGFKLNSVFVEKELK